LVKVQDYPQCDKPVGSSEELNDERINMSVTFDKLVRDDISTGVTFDFDHRESLPINSMSDDAYEKSLEITVENYLEYEALKRGEAADSSDELSSSNCISEEIESISSTKKKEIDESMAKGGKTEAQKELEIELEALRTLKRKVEEEQKLQEMKAILEEEHKQKSFLKKLNMETELVKKLKQRVANAKESARVKKAEMEVQSMRKSMETNRTTRVPASEKMQERLKSTVDMIASANTAQDLLDLEVAKISARASNRATTTKPVKSVMMPLSDNSKRLVAPPPVKEKLKLPYNYKYNPDMDVDPSFSFIERFEYDETSMSSGSTAQNSKGHNGESKNVEVLTRPGYVKPAPSGVTKALSAVAGFAEDIKSALSELKL
jgi:hypothetical protein